jgi:hypothetical protein
MGDLWEEFCAHPAGEPENGAMGVTGLDPKGEDTR